ncbi:CcdB family protein [Sphingomonas sp. ID0503]|uniref:CcdB family protein n=1 Tax=Sphingomonas sp. ID0503 TaxID=3399691 RepID=UPI003AFA9A10
MARFDVYRVRGEPYAVDCQSDVFSRLNSRLVVPLRPAHMVPAVAPRLNPVLKFDGLDLRLVPQAARAIRTKEIEATIGSLSEQDVTILAAMDMLISGY